MKVYSECAPMSTERICQMRGKAQDIVNCLGDVLALLETVRIKQFIQYLISLRD